MEKNLYGILWSISTFLIILIINMVIIKFFHGVLKCFFLSQNKQLL